jgi:tol-pal system protein YbgF
MVLATGCASSPSPVDEGSRAVLAAQAEARRAAELEAENRAHEDRIQQLEGQLALARAEVADLREVRSPAPIDETVRIGGDAPGVADEWVDTDGVAVTGALAPGADDPRAGDGAPRPVLTLYGSPAVSLAPDGPAFGGSTPSAASSAPLAYDSGRGGASAPLAYDSGRGGASAPLAYDSGRGGASAPLPVRAAGTVPPIPLAPSPAPPPTQPAVVAARPPSRSDAAVERYRAALSHVQAQRLPEALVALTAFLDQFPAHPYADNALYWRGEVEYAMRRYEGALRDFQRLVEEHPRGNKVPDALLKMGLCHLRMGDSARARAYFRRVRNEYPESVAARLASQEDAS